MNAFDALMVDELRREFRRTRPPSYMLKPEYEPCICHIEEAHKQGFRLIWKIKKNGLCVGQPNTINGRTVTIIEILPL